MSKKNKKQFTLDEFDRGTLAQYFLGKRDGMFEAYELIDESITELKRSLDNVWMIYEQADWYVGGSNKEDKEKLIFAINTLLVFQQSFQGKYDEEIEKAKRDAEEFEEG